MVDLLSSAPQDVRLIVLCALALLLMVVVLPVLLAGLSRPHLPARHSFRAGYLTTLALGCALLLTLSGCGTAPPRACTCPPVPAELLTPPQEPVLLQAPTPSPTPGATTSRTRLDAASTASTCSG